jgi:hypothetical protein
MTSARITSILNAKSLDFSITDFSTFSLSRLKLSSKPVFDLPTNLRLGHLAERVVSGLINASSNYELLHENIQLIENKKTIGELDFILREIESQQLIHLELAYKFYLFDPSISADQVNNWIGPNRNDSLKEKLAKLKNKQFPLLHHPCTKATLQDIFPSDVSQALCFLISLFIPYEFKSKLAPEYEKAVKGYYLNFNKFLALDDSEKTYYIPAKKEWGIAASENSIWNEFKEVKEQLKTAINEKQAVLIWQKAGAVYSEIFVIWW